MAIFAPLLAQVLETEVCGGTPESKLQKKQCEGGGSAVAACTSIKDFFG